MTRRSTAAEASVPKPQALRASAPLSLADVVKDNASKPARVLIDVAAPQGRRPLTCSPKARRGLGACPCPSRSTAPADPQHKRFAVVLDGLPSGTSAKGATLKITAVSGGQAIETDVPLD